VVDSLYAYADNFDVIYKTTTGGVGSFDGVSAQASNSGPITVEGFGGLFNVHDASLSTHKVIVFNLLGERVLEVANPRASEFTLDLSMLPAGIYFARFEMAGGAVEMRKIVVEGK